MLDLAKLFNEYEKFPSWLELRAGFIEGARKILASFTERIRSLRKVLFSQACVIHSVHKEGCASSQNACITGQRRVGVWSEGGGGGGGGRPPEMATVAVGTHPTGMHSCHSL